MKTRHLLFLLYILSFTPLVLTSCGDDDDEDVDLTNIEGTYSGKFTFSMKFEGINYPVPAKENVDFVVKKTGDNKVTITYNGDTMNATIDSKGNLTSPDETGTITENYEGTQVTVTGRMKYTGKLTNTTLYWKEDFTGKTNVAGIDVNVTAQMEFKGEKK